MKDNFYKWLVGAMVAFLTVAIPVDCSRESDLDNDIQKVYVRQSKQEQEIQDMINYYMLKAEIDTIKARLNGRVPRNDY